MKHCACELLKSSAAIPCSTSIPYVTCMYLHVGPTIVSTKSFPRGSAHKATHLLHSPTYTSVCLSTAQITFCCSWWSPKNIVEIHYSTKTAQFAVHRIITISFMDRRRANLLRSILMEVSAAFTVYVWTVVVLWLFFAAFNNSQFDISGSTFVRFKTSLDLKHIFIELYKSTCSPDFGCAECLHARSVFVWFSSVHTNQVTFDLPISNAISGI